MLKTLLSLTLLSSLVTTAFADEAYVPPAQPHFAQAPHMAPRPPQHRITDTEPDPGLLAPALDRASVRAALVQQRATNLAAFRAYQKAGVFPSNTFSADKLNVWRDADGHYCAAATIIKMSGQDQLVAKVAEQSNFIRLADVRQGPLMDWILTSGFTQDEIAAIQEPFMPVARPEPRPAPVVVDARMRATEDARLRAKYIAVDKQLVKSESRSIELAVDRLMKHEQLAWQLVATAARARA